MGSSPNGSQQGIGLTFPVELIGAQGIPPVILDASIGQAQTGSPVRRSVPGLEAPGTLSQEGEGLVQLPGVPEGSQDVVGVVRAPELEAGRPLPDRASRVLQGPGDREGLLPVATQALKET